MILETERLILRPFEKRDVEVYQTLVGDAEVMRFIPPREPVGADIASRWVEYWAEHFKRHGFGVWILFDRDDGEFVGHGGLQRLQSGEVEVLYAIVRARWGEGLATEVAAASLRHGFETLALDSIIGLADEENTASCRVLEKCGMEFTGMATDYSGEELKRYEIGRALAAPLTSE